jgi:dTDP-4-dehydrorhamnose reductase
MKALIIGGTGLVGYSLWRDWKARGWEVYGTYFSHPADGLESLDIRDAKAVASCIDRVKPEAVVIASANPYVD